MADKILQAADQVLKSVRALDTPEMSYYYQQLEIDDFIDALTQDATAAQVAINQNSGELSQHERGIAVKPLIGDVELLLRKLKVDSIQGTGYEGSIYDSIRNLGRVLSDHGYESAQMLTAGRGRSGGFSLG